MLTVLDLFSGIGGFSLGLEATGGFRTVAFCEQEPFARSVLEKHYPGVPIFPDVRNIRFSNLQAVGIGNPDVVCGGFPCQDISLAGKGAGLSGERSGLWFEFLRIIGETTPRFVIIENVAALRSRGLDQILRGLASIGYDAEWHCIPASALGAPHRRDRVWIVAYPQCAGLEGSIGRRLHIERGAAGLFTDMDEAEQPGGGASVAYSACGGRREHGHVSSAHGDQGDGQPAYRSQSVADAGGAGLPGTERTRWGKPIVTPADIRRAIAERRWRRAEPGMGRTADGIPDRAHRYPVEAEPWEGKTPRTVGRGVTTNRRHRLMALGNSVVPQIPELIGHAILRASHIT